ncbi:MAG: T9SS type A sorting domain-containing protein [Bacteroidales bacterium]|nr:T9SS type A sorting domain-containing protein [Bacteroidales bacterium]
MRNKIIIVILMVFSLNIQAENWLGWGYEGFNSSGIPFGWSEETVTGLAGWVTYGGIYTPYEGSGNIYFSTLISAIGDESILVAEPFSNSGIDNSYFTFWHMQKSFADGGGNNELRVYYRVSPSSSWVLLEEYLDPIEEWKEELIMLPETSATIELGFKALIIGGEAMSPEGVAIDLVSIKYFDEDACFAPINLSVAGVATTTADIDWEEIGSATSWDIEYGTHNYSQGEGTPINGIQTNPEYTITGLTPGNQYDVYVRSDCGETQSDWIGPVTFFTDCEVITSFPYEETFPNSDFDDEDWNDGFTVNCWYEEYGEIGNPTSFTGAVSDWSPREFGNPQDYNPENSNCAAARAGFGHSWLFSPTFDIETSNNFQLEFDVAATDYNGNTVSFTNEDILAIVISTDGSWNENNIIKQWTASENPSEITTDGIHVVVDLSAYTGEVELAYYLSGASGSSIYAYIDNVKVKTVELNPLFELLEPTEWNAGPLLVNTTVNSGQIFGIRNSGVSTLSINGTSSLASTEFSTDFNENITLDPGEEYYFSFTYSPTDLVDDEKIFGIYTDYGSGTIQLNGVAYDLDPCEVEIGIDDQENNIPMRFAYNYSYSQFIYLQSEIDRSDEAVNFVYFYYNGFDDYYDNTRNISIFMKHTPEDELEGWSDINTFTEVATEVAVTFEEEGWYEIPLETEFIYNNTDNLQIAFYSQATGTHMAQASLYSHDAPDDKLMTIVTYNGGEIDLENPPPLSPIAKRPNIRMCLLPPSIPEFELQDPTEWVVGPIEINTIAESGDIFTIANIGDAPLSINSITDLSATEFSTSFNDAITLEAGEEYSFSFSYSPTDLVNDEVDFIITTDYGNGTIHLNGSALELVPVFELQDPTVWVVGPIEINTTEESGDIFTIANIGDAPLSINSITDLSATEFSTNFNDAITLDAGEEYSFSFSYSPTDLVDDEVDFVITTDYGNGTIHLSGSAYDMDPIFELLDPAEWVVGPVEVGTTEESGGVFSIKNAGEGTLSIESITDLSATEFMTSFDDGITLGAGEEYSFSFSYSPVDIVDDEVDFVITTAFGTGTIHLSATAEIIDGFEEVNTDMFSIYPNPVQDKLYIVFTDKSLSYDIELFSMSGKLIMQENTNHSKEKTIDVSHLENGIYLIKSNEVVYKFVKQ